MKDWLKVALVGLSFTAGVAALVADAVGGDALTAGVAAAVASLVTAMLSARERSDAKSSEEFCVKGVAADGTVGFVWVAGRFDPLKPAQSWEPQPERHERNGLVVQKPPPPPPPPRRRS